MQPILVTGSPRSGTSWIGKMIDLSHKIGYIPEPYNVMILENLPGEPSQELFGIISEIEARGLKKDFKRIIDLQYSFADQFTTNRSIPNFVNSMISHLKFRSYRKKGLVPLIKDPFMIFSVEWMTQQFGVKPVILIRHPGPILDSYKRLNWQVDFDHLCTHLNHPELVAILQNYNIEKSKAMDIETQVGILWTLIHKQIEIYQKTYSNWLFLRYEDIFLNLESNFRIIFDYLGLDLNDDILANIYHYTSRGYFKGSSRTSYSRLERKDLLNGWKNRLSDNQINVLQDTVNSTVYNIFYSEENWYNDVKF